MKLLSIKKYVLIFFGTVFVALGVIGIFIPVLPTTPFLLLASFCYLKSSKSMYNWLLNHKIFGSYLYCYLTYKAISRKTKIGTIIFLWATLILSMLFVPSLHLRIFLLIVGIGVTTHLIILKTLSPEDRKTVNNLYCNKAKEQKE